MRKFVGFLILLAGIFVATTCDAQEKKDYATGYKPPITLKAVNIDLGGVIVVAPDID